MRLANVGIVFGRELRDQLRDRRTLFMVVFLPILLYPMLGLGMAQFVQAFQQKPRTVVLVGAENLPDDPPLLNRARDEFRAEYFFPPTEAEAAKLKVRPVRSEPPWTDPKAVELAVRGGEADAVVIIPADFRQTLLSGDAARLPVAYNSADEQSLNLRHEGPRRPGFVAGGDRPGPVEEGE